MSTRWSTADRPKNPTLDHLRHFVDEVAQDLDRESRYVSELLAVLEASDDVQDYRARLGHREHVARFRKDGSVASEGERGYSWVDDETWKRMCLFERTLANLLTGETRMMWAGEGAADFEHLDDALEGHAGPLSVLSVPCSTGKEVFSLVIAALEAKLDVSATGVDRQSAYVVRANSGRLVHHHRDWEHEVADEYLLRGEDGVTRVAPRVLERCAFVTGDVLTGDLPEGPFDLVSCRNLLGYFRGDTLETAWRNVAARVRPGGHLLLDGFVTGAEEMELVPELLSEHGFERRFEVAHWFRAASA